jgi:negative regulator of flagellin synthesis FlgM
MEITRQPHLGLNATRQADAPGLQTHDSTGPVVPVTAVQAVKPALEQIQTALGQLPQADLEKVAAIKAALASGELASDSASLACAMLTYHRGADR